MVNELEKSPEPTTTCLPAIVHEFIFALLFGAAEPWLNYSPISSSVTTRHRWHWLCKNQCPVNFSLTGKIYTLYWAYRIISKWLLENGLAWNQSQNDRHSIDTALILGLENEKPISMGAAQIQHIYYLVLAMNNLGMQTKGHLGSSTLYQFSSLPLK